MKTHYELEREQEALEAAEYAPYAGALGYDMPQHPKVVEQDGAVFQLEFDMDGHAQLTPANNRAARLAIRDTLESPDD